MKVIKKSINLHILVNQSTFTYQGETNLLTQYRKLQRKEKLSQTTKPKDKLQLLRRNSIRVT